MNEEELRNLMYTAQLPEIQGPFSIRYPRGNGAAQPDAQGRIHWKTPFRKIIPGTGRCLKTGSNIAVLSLGHPGNLVSEALQSESLKDQSIGHYDMRFAKPLDTNLLHEIFNRYTTLITVEDGCIQGGFGSAVLEFMSDQGYSAKVVRLGIPDHFVEHGEQAELYEECGFSPAQIVKTIQSILHPTTHFVNTLYSS